MYKKECPNCKKTSYSASLGKDWICPYCSTILNEVKAEVAGTVIGGNIKVEGTLTVDKDTG